MLVSLVVRARRNKVETGEEGMIGQVGARRHGTRSPKVRCSCMASIGTLSRPGPLAAGARVRVTAIDRLKLTVEPVPDQTGG